MISTSNYKTVYRKFFECQYILRFITAKPIFIFWKCHQGTWYMQPPERIQHTLDFAAHSFLAGLVEMNNQRFPS